MPKLKYVLIVVLLLSRSLAAFGFPPNLKQLSILLNTQGMLNANEWKIVPMASNYFEDSRSVQMNVHSSDGSALDFYTSYVSSKSPLKFRLMHTPINTEIKSSHYDLTLKWNDEKGFFIDSKLSQHCFITKESKLYRFATEYYHQDYVHEGAQPQSLVNTQNGTLALNLSEIAPSEDAVDAGLISSDTEETDGGLFEQPTFRVVLVNDPNNVKRTHTFFALRSLRVWPEYIDKRVTSGLASAGASRLRQLNNVRYSQETLPISIIKYGDPSQTLLTGKARVNPITQVAGELTSLAQFFSSGNHISLVVEQLKQGLNKQTTKQSGYLKFEIKGDKVRLLEGNAFKFVKGFEARKEKYEGYDLYTLALIMKTSSDLGESSSMVEEDRDAQWLPGAVREETDGKKNQQPVLFPKSEKEAKTYVTTLSDFFGNSGVPF